ncbi:MAG TPA: endonuclease MutS2 [Spirochaetales bacterium]|mgnify:CR=1 FL=1|nr:endonuclease MutS2 [Spirochaetales bacterium]HOV37738.1 endonuclease MutS2 [Spirochaetales bacterium]
MNEHALELLDFLTVREEVESYAWSIEGKNQIQSEEFFTRRTDLESFRTLVREFRNLFETLQENPQFFFPDITEAVHTAEKPGSQLEGKEIAGIIQYLQQSRQLKGFLGKGETELQEEAGDLPDLSDLARVLGKFVDPEGNLKEQEIPSLRTIGERIRYIRREIDKIAISYLQNTLYRGYWQSDVPSLKDGRIVLPLNIHFRGKIRGVVHEVSARGATVFFEPLDIFERNNRLIEEENEYRWEVVRILRELTAKIHDRIPELVYLRERIAVLDSRQARARYGRVHACTFAEVDSDRICVRSARHPLLGSRAVPIDLELPPGTRILILSGPNTGGKTVALKTLGLLALLNQFGLEIPASDSSLPLFDSVFVDIGDEQSITESLSTFSAHIRNLSRIYKECTEYSLILLDELGAGTDPEEGSALAMAFLESFQRKQAFLFGTTHLGTVKHFVFSRPGMINASVDFNVEELKPTYRILSGIPGPSYALEIAERCGAPAAVLDIARSHLQAGETDYSRTLRDLMEKEQEYQKRLEEVGQIEDKLKDQYEKLKNWEANLSQKELELRSGGIRELADFLSTARKELEALVRHLKEGELNREKIRTSQDFLQNIQSFLVQQLSRQEEVQRKTLKPLSIPLEPGMEVRIRNHTQKGILRKHLKGDVWEVAVGTLRIQVPERDIAEASIASNKEERVSFVDSFTPEPPRLELDLRGMRVEEALQALERQIDAAVLHSLKEFGIIHGKGEGILQNSVHQYLSHCPQVEEFHFALPEAGGTGRTLVRMKQ